MKLPAKSGGRAITLVEVLIVVAISLVLVTAATPIYSNIQVSTQVDDAASQIIQTIRIARGRAIARVNNASHGVYFDATAKPPAYTLYQGDSYALRNSIFDRTTKLDPPFQMSSTFPASDVNFSKGAGTSTAGTITLIHSAGGSRTITITSSVTTFGVVQ